MGRRAVAAQPSILNDQPLAPFLQHLCSLFLDRMTVRGRQPTRSFDLQQYDWQVFARLTAWPGAVEADMRLFFGVAGERVLGPKRRSWMMRARASADRGGMFEKERAS